MCVAEASVNKVNVLNMIISYGSNSIKEHFLDVFFSRLLDQHPWIKLNTQRIPGIKIMSCSLWALLGCDIVVLTRE